jgi:hypothetical protein
MILCESLARKAKATLNPSLSIFDFRSCAERIVPPQTDHDHHIHRILAGHAHSLTTKYANRETKLSER